MKTLMYQTNIWIDRYIDVKDRCKMLSELNSLIKAKRRRDSGWPTVKQAIEELDYCTKTGRLAIDGKRKTASFISKK